MLGFDKKNSGQLVEIQADWDDQWKDLQNSETA